MLDGSGIWSGVGVGCGLQDAGQGAGDGLAVGLQGGDELVQVHALGSLGHGDDLVHGARQVRAAGVLAEFAGQCPDRAGEVVGHAGELVEQGGGEPVGARRRRISPGGVQVMGEIVVAGGDVLGLGPDVGEADGGALEFQGLAGAPATVFQGRAVAECLLEVCDVALAFEGLLRVEQDALGVGQAPERDQRPGYPRACSPRSS
jgi:hypothetical protein